MFFFDVNVIRFSTPRLLIERTNQPSGSDKSRPQQYVLPADTVPPKVWRELENPSLDTARCSGRLEHQQYRSVDAWQNLAQVCSRHRAKSGYAYRDRGSVLRRHSRSAETL